MDQELIDWFVGESVSARAEDQRAPKLSVDEIAMAFGVEPPSRLVNYEGQSVGLQSLSMYGINLADLDEGDEPDARDDCAEMILSLQASVADQLAAMTEQAKFLDALAAAAREVTEHITKALCCATDADMPGIRAHVPQPEPAPQPKASTVKPALTSLTTMHSIDHRPGLWQAADGQA